MSNMNPIIDIKATGTGWVRCTVRPARRNYVFSASYDSDALGSLVIAALSIMSDINSISFKFYGNYSDWIWMIERNAADHIEIEILEATPNLSGPLGEYDLKPVVKFSRTPIAFAQSIHITASEMLKKHGPTNYKELSVYHDFPKEFVQLLGKRITARQNDA